MLRTAKAKSAYEGSSVLFEYHALLSTMATLLFTRPNGESTVHIASVDLADNGKTYNVWYLHPRNPWYYRINRYVYAYMEQGLKAKWMQDSR